MDKRGEKRKKRVRSEREVEESVDERKVRVRRIEEETIN